MAENEFGGMLYRTQSAMLDAIAYDWVTGGGSVSLADGFRDTTDEQLADECIKDWELDRGGDDESPSHMQAQEYTRDGLIRAFADLREAYQDGGLPTE